MTPNPDSSTDAPGVNDFNLPMAPLTIKFRVAWLATLKSVAIRENKGASALVREAVVEWADARGINLNGF